MTGRLLAIARCCRGLALALAASGCAGLQAPRTARPGNLSSLDLRLADATLSAGAAGTALHVVDTMLERNPDDVAALLRRGRALMMLDRPAEAAASFARAAALDRASLEALVGLARARVAEGDARDAETAWRLALARDPRDSRLQAGLAVSLDLQERHAEAQALYREALAARPDDPAVRSDLGLSLALSGHPAQGIPLLREAAQGGFGTDDEEAKRARHNLAAGFVMAGDEQAARTVLSEDLPPAEIAPALAGLRQFAATQ